MDTIALARVLHTLSVLLWIGGVGMVTTVIIPAVRKMKSPAEQLQYFEEIEGRFAPQARVLVLLAGLSGFYMVYALDGWSRYLDGRYWWMHGMTLVWLIFSVILFILEPLVVRKLIRSKALGNPAALFLKVYRVHWLLLVLSLLTAAGAVAGAHGWFWIH